MTYKQRYLEWIVLVLCVVLLGACAGSGVGPSGVTDNAVEKPAKSLEKIRYSEVVAWQMLGAGRLLVELNNPRRSYILELMPSCIFEFRQATDFVFAGKSANFISVNDDVVVGNSRCRIIRIYETDEKRKAQIRGVRRVD